MKKYLIVLFLVIAQLGAFYLKSHSQSENIYKKRSIDTTAIINKWSTVKDNTSIITKEVEIEVLTDETTLSYTAKFAKIECDNDKVFMKLFTTHYQLITRFSAAWKVDQKGNAYKRYTIFLSKEDSEIIKSWAKTNL